MAKPKKEIDTKKVKSVYFKNLERIRTAYNMRDSLHLVGFSRDITFGAVAKAKQELSDLKDTHEFNDFNDKVLAEKAGRLMGFEKELSEVIKSVQSEVDTVNRLIAQINRNLSLKEKQLYEKFLLDQKDV